MDATKTKHQQYWKTKLIEDEYDKEILLNLARVIKKTAGWNIYHKKVHKVLFLFELWLRSKGVSLKSYFNLKNHVEFVRDYGYTKCLILYKWRAEINKNKNIDTQDNIKFKTLAQFTEYEVNIPEIWDFRFLFSLRSMRQSSKNKSVINVDKTFNEWIKELSKDEV